MAGGAMRSMVMAMPMFLAAATAQAKMPDCSQWFATMTWVQLKNEGLIDSSRTTSQQGKLELLAQQQLKRDLARYVYRVTFPGKHGAAVEAIAVGNSSTTECSETGVNVFVVSKFIDGGP